MAHVNLLPWREAQRQQKKQNYLIVLAATAVIAALLFWFIGQMIDQKIANQNARNQYLQSETTKLDMIIGEIQRVKDSKTEIEKRMALIEQLQTSRNLAPIVLDELVRVLPPGISFSSMTRIDNTIEIDGVSDSNNRLSELMRKMDTSRVFLEPELTSIVADTSARKSISSFNLKVKLLPNLDTAFKQESGQ